MVDEDSLREQLDELKAEHKALDEQIDLLTRSQAVDFLTIAKLKKKSCVSKTRSNVLKVC